MKESALYNHNIPLELNQCNLNAISKAIQSSDTISYNGKFLFDET